MFGYCGNLLGREAVWGWNQTRSSSMHFSGHMAAARSRDSLHATVSMRGSAFSRAGFIRKTSGQMTTQVSQLLQRYVSMFTRQFMGCLDW